MSQIGQKTWPPRTNESSQWAGLRNDWPYLPHRLSYQNQTSWAYVQNEPGKLPTKAFWAQPIGGAINAKNLYLKDHWTEFHQIWYAYSRGDYWLISWVPWWNVKVGVACASLTVIFGVLLIYGRLEGPRDMKLGTWTINDVQILHKKFGPRGRYDIECKLWIILPVAPQVLLTWNVTHTSSW